jgi:hypothetical protein
LTTYKQKCTVPPLPNPPKSPTPVPDKPPQSKNPFRDTGNPPFKPIILPNPFKPVPKVAASNKTACVNIQQLTVQAQAINLESIDVSFVLQFNRRYNAFKNEAIRLRAGGAAFFEKTENRKLSGTAQYTCADLFSANAVSRVNEIYKNSRDSQNQLYNKCFKPIAGIARSVYNGSISQCSKTIGGKI